jgi:hypothetical protein
MKNRGKGDRGAKFPIVIVRFSFYSIPASFFYIPAEYFLKSASEKFISPYQISNGNP